VVPPSAEHLLITKKNNMNQQITSWRDVLKSPLSRAEIHALLFLVLNLPEDFDYGQRQFAHCLDVETSSINRTLRKLNDKGLIDKTLLKNYSRILKISLHPNLKIMPKISDWGLVRIKRTASRRKNPNKIDGRKNKLKGRWSLLGFDACVVCGQTTSPHYIKGMCRRCWERAYRRDYRAQGRDKWMSEKGWKK